MLSAAADCNTCVMHPLHFRRMHPLALAITYSDGLAFASEAFSYPSLQKAEIRSAEGGGPTKELHVSRSEEEDSHNAPSRFPFDAMSGAPA